MRAGYAADVGGTTASTEIGLAASKQALGLDDEANQHLQKAIELDPNSDLAHYNLGMSEARLDKLSEAKESFGRALEINPEHAAGHLILGVLAASAEDYAAATWHLKEACRLMPENADAHEHLGEVLARNEKPEDILSLLSPAQKRLTSAKVYFFVGVAHAQLGDWSDAESSFNEALKIKPDFSDATVNLAIAKTNQGQVEEAIRLLEEAIATDPENERLDRLMSEMKNLPDDGI